MPTGDDLRAAMRRFPAGIAVVTLSVGETRIGVTVGSLVSLSLEPPLVGLSIGRDTSPHELIREAGGFVVNVLSAEQADLASHFARSVPPIVMWDGIAIREGVRAPLLDGALAWLECALADELAVGDHTFFVGVPERIELGETGRGLAYREGAYHPA